MYYNNLMFVKDGASAETFFIVLAIIAVTTLLYAIGFSELARRQKEKIIEAKQIAIQLLNFQNKKKEKHDDDI